MLTIHQIREKGNANLTRYLLIIYYLFVFYPNKKKELLSVPSTVVNKLGGSLALRIMQPLLMWYRLVFLETTSIDQYPQFLNFFM